MISTKLESPTLISRNLKNNYTDFKFINQTSYYKIYQAKSQLTQEIHTIRILDPSCNLVEEDFNQAVTLFLQEILHLCQLPGGREAIIPELFEFQGDKIYFISKPYYPLDYELSNLKNVQYDISKLLKDLSSEMRYLLKKKNFNDLSADLQNVFRFEGTNSFFIGDWAKYLSPNSMSTSILSRPSLMSQPDTSEDTSNCVYSLGKLALRVGGLEHQDLEDLAAISNVKLYNASLDSLLNTLNVGADIKALLRNMLNKDPDQRLTLNGLLQEPGNDELKRAKTFNEKTGYDVYRSQNLIERSQSFVMNLSSPDQGKLFFGSLSLLRG